MHNAEFDGIRTPITHLSVFLLQFCGSADVELQVEQIQSANISEGLNKIYNYS